MCRCLRCIQIGVFSCSRRECLRKASIGEASTLGLPFLAECRHSPRPPMRLRGSQKVPHEAFPEAPLDPSCEQDNFNSGIAPGCPRGPVGRSRGRRRAATDSHPQLCLHEAFHEVSTRAKPTVLQIALQSVSQFIPQSVPQSVVPPSVPQSVPRFVPQFVPQFSGEGKSIKNYMLFVESDAARGCVTQVLALKLVCPNSCPNLSGEGKSTKHSMFFY